MMFRQEISMIYDTIFFGVAQFNREHITKSLGNRFSMGEFLKEVEEKAKPIPELLAPIFIAQGEGAAAINSFFDEHIDFETDTFESFVNKLLVRKDDLRNKMLSALLPDIKIDFNEPETLLAAIDISEYDAGSKLRILYVFDNFEFAINLLMRSLMIAHDEIVHIYKQYAKEIDETVQRVSSENNRNLYKQVFSTDIPKEPSYLAISLLNPNISHIMIKQGRQECLFGIHHENALCMMLNEANLDMRQILIAIGNDTRLSILKTLSENGEMTSTIIAKRICQPITTVLRHVEILFNSGIINISRKSGLQIFYRINFELLERATKAAERKIAQMSDNVEVGE